MTLRQTQSLLLLLWCCRMAAQTSCFDPITINSILVSNSTCGNATGTIIVTPAGGSAAFSFSWTPSVSNSNVATNLAAGTYQVHIVRANDPDCMLDTTIIVNNSNGPQIQAAIDPADCLASNGSVTLSPTNLLYSWSNGAGTNAVQNLASGNYYVTATNGGTGCYSVNKIFVPRSFAFNVSANVTRHAKCGHNTGSAQIVVAQGSGQYSYSLGNGPVFDHLAAGFYTCVVSDNVTGCVGTTSFTILDQQVSGVVSLTTHDVRCSGNAGGGVEIQVIPGANFQLPYVYTLVNGAGQVQSPGNLAAGTYYLQIFDFDQCPLPADTFVIQQPPPILVQTAIQPDACDQAGSIQLQISGGEAPYTVNWLDMPGDVNPVNRNNLEAGLYSAIVYDSLFCPKQVDNLLVSPLCNGVDTVFMVVKANTTDSFCRPKPVGLPANSTTFQLVGGGSSGSSSNGAWFLNADGCVAYSAGPNPGFAVDTFCVVRTAIQIGLKDTLCLIATITAKAPTKQSVFFSVQTLSAAVACGTIPAAFGAVTIAQIGRPGLAGTSDVYGHYSIQPDNGCISFYAGPVTGFSVDEIKVGIFDTLLNECHIISYLPSVIPAVDCSSLVNLADSMQVTAPDCSSLALGCIPIPYDDIVNFTVIDNGVLYSAGYNGCNPVNTFSYNVNALPTGGGPYQLTEWKINGQSHSGTFLNIAGLAALLNQLDPGQGWALQGATYLRGGQAGAAYGPLAIRSASGVMATFDPVFQAVSMGTELRFSPGTHRLVFRNVLNACSDTIVVQADCIDCPSVHHYDLDPQGNIVWNLGGACAADTVFCTDILLSDKNNYTFTDSQQSAVEFTECGDWVGMVLDTGFHLLHIVSNSSVCEYYIRVYVQCASVIPSDSSELVLAIGGQGTVCLGPGLLNGPPATLVNLCPTAGGGVLFSFQYQSGLQCVDITGLNVGDGALCLQWCNNAGQCVQHTVLVKVREAPSDSLLAVPDRVFTLINTDVDIPILANDIVRGLVGNYSELAGVEFPTQPQLGNFDFNPLSGLLIYSPEDGVCGVDSFTYRITDSLGRQSSTMVEITISCDKVLVFNGLSPNGDGRNDTWTILGIELFPFNEVHVFNRWGNQVFEKKGYSNSQPWDGTWNGKDLPDGTYFYTLNLGGAGGRLEGYLQILR